MFDELCSASEQLNTALERYLRACSSIQGSCLHGITLRNIPSEHAQQFDRELELVESYDAKVQKAKLAIKTSRNHAFNISPVARLPPEILTRIFHMVRDADPCSVDSLEFVCSRWRSIALESPSLWSHIHYLPDASKWFYPGLLARARLHASRSGGMPLDIHISSESVIYNNGCDDKPVTGLCKLVAPRTRSLYLELEGIHGQWFDGTNSVIKSLISGCTPGTLTKVATTDPERFGFITAKEDRVFEDSTLYLDMKLSDLNSIFSPVTVLHLTGLFPIWTSHAYHGLVDLRLCVQCVPGDTIIPEAQLVKILNSSPALRILHFELRISRRTGRRVPAPRVHLADLEVLHVKSGFDNTSFHQVEDFLRLLEPGPNPLHLSIWHHPFPANTKISTIETRAFFTRSNITKLQAASLPQMLELLPSLPNLKVLLLSELVHWDQTIFRSPPNHCQGDRESTHPRLNQCFILNCTLPLEQLIVLTQSCDPQTLTIFGSTFHRDRPDENIGAGVVEKELSKVCSNIKITNTPPNLAEHLDLLSDS